MKASIPIVVLLLLTSTPATFAQDKPPKSPKPQQQVVNLKGFITEGCVVNHIDGVGRYLNSKGVAQVLKPLQEFESGDEIQVGADSYVEVLLTPGSFLRLAANARVRFIDISPDNLKLQLISGSAILENIVPPLGIYEHANGKASPNDVRSLFDSGYQAIDVLTPQGDFMLARGGLYRCDIGADGRTSLQVLTGLAVIPGDVLSDGMSAMLGDRVATIEKIDPSREDKFGAWSRGRAIALVAASNALGDTPWGRKLRKDRMTYLSIEYPERQARMKEALTISAVAGAVGFAEPGAVYQSHEGSWQPLTTDVELKAGDRVKTNTGARVEIHLYPECYFLLDGNSEIVYGARPDGGVAIRLINGSAMMVSSLKRKGGVFTSLLVPTNEIEISEAGVYRLNASSARAAELLVYEGSATIQGQVISEGRRAVLGGSAIEIDRARAADIDPFELWSRKRSHLLILAQFMEAFNQRFDPKHRPAISPRSAHRVITTGLWYLFAETDTYTFVPAGPDRRSPYGLKYEFWFRSE
jgi:hypothetical protein